MTQEFTEIGYNLTVNMLNSVDFGVPQFRNRLFLIGSKYYDPLTIKKADKRQITVHDAISDLPLIENGARKDILPYCCEPESNYAKKFRANLTECSGHLVSRNSALVLERYKHIKQGENWEAIPQNLMSNYSNPSRCHTGIYHRLHEAYPSIVIGNFRKSMLIHPLIDRGLSIREAARLQSFPDWYVFRGSIGNQQQQVGDAVPPLMAMNVFKSIIEVM